MRARLNRPRRFNPFLPVCDMRRVFPQIAVVVIAALAAVPPVQGAEPAAAEVEFRATPEQEAFFEKNVRPILVARCLECHGEKKQEAGLRLDSRAALLKDG